MTASCRSDGLAGQVKERVSVAELLEAEGYPIGRHGTLRCPLHAGDRTPSFKVYPDGRGWYCFGCHQGGDVISLAMALWSLPFRTAVEELVRRFALGLPLGEQGEKAARRQAALAAWKRRDRRKTAAGRYARDWAAWARANETVRAGPDESDPWTWVAAVVRRDELSNRLEAQERGGRHGL